MNTLTKEIEIMPIPTNSTSVNFPYLASVDFHVFVCLKRPLEKDILKLYNEFGKLLMKSETI